jgi:hypothetical protein
MMLRGLIEDGDILAKRSERKSKRILKTLTYVGKE